MYNNQCPETSFSEKIILFSNLKNENNTGEAGLPKVQIENFGTAAFIVTPAHFFKILLKTD